MIITPARLLLLSVAALMLFCLPGFYRSKMVDDDPAISKYSLDGGSFISLKSSRFDLDPFLTQGRLFERIRPGSPSPPLPSVPAEQAPGPRPDLPGKENLVGEVARSVLDGTVSELRPSLVDALPQMIVASPPLPIPMRKAPPVLAAKAPDAKVPPSKATVPGSRKRSPSQVTSPQELMREARKTIASGRRLARTDPKLALEKLTPITEDRRLPTRLRALAYYWKGKAHKASNEPVTALANLRKAVELAPNNAFLLNGLAWTLVTIRPRRLRNPQEALSLALKAVELNRSANHLDTLAKAYFDCGKAMKALEVQQEAIELAPGDRSFLRRYRRYQAAVTAD